MSRKRKKPDYLTEKEFACLELYLKYGNKSKAGREAGYSEKSAGVIASNLIKSAKGQRYLNERMKKVDDKKIASADEVMEYLTAVMRGDETDQFGLDAPLSERTKAAQELAKRLIDTQNIAAELSVTIVNDIPKPKAEENDD